MEVTGFPTSCDIYLELEGKKVAVVQSYTAKATKTSQVVEAFGTGADPALCYRRGYQRRHRLLRSGQLLSGDL